METKIKCDGYTLTVKGHTLTKVEVEPGTQQVIIPEGITKVGEYAFNFIPIISVIFPESLRSLSAGSFSDCQSLTEVFIANKVQRLTGLSFKDCAHGGLRKKVHIGCGVQYMDDSFIRTFDYFNVDSNNSMYTSIGGALFSKDMKILYFFPSEYIGSYKVPETVEKLWDFAFYGSQLSTILLPSSICEIGESCFSSSITLSKIDVYSSDLAYRPPKEDVTLPPNLKKISEWCFCDCHEISSVVIPPKVERIESHAFCNTGLKELVLPSSLKYLGRNAFRECQLSNVRLPNSLISIGDAAFGYNPLSEVELPTGLREICGCAFLDCKQLNRITVSPGNKNLVAVNNFVFSKDMSRLLMANPNYNGSFIVPDTVREIADAAFAYTDIRSVTIPSSVEKIGERAFMDCFKLTSVCLENGIKSIGKYAFYSTNSLKEIYLPDSIIDFKTDFIFNGECRLIGPDSSTNTKYLRYLNSRHVISDNFVSCTALERKLKLKKLEELYVRTRIEAALTERNKEYIIVSKKFKKNGKLPLHPHMAFFRIKLYKDNKKFDAQIDRWCRKDNRFLVLILNENELWNRI